MKQRFSITVVFSFFQVCAFVAQTSGQPSRTCSIYSTLGFPDGLAVGARYQLSKSFALGTKLILIDGGEMGRLFFPASGKGIGATFAYYFDESGRDNFLGLNSCNFDLTYVRQEEGPNTTASSLALEQTLGHDSTIGSGLRFALAIGVCETIVLSRHGLEPKARFSMVLKFGIRYNI